MHAETCQWHGCALGTARWTCLWHGPRSALHLFVVRHGAHTQSFIKSHRRFTYVKPRQTDRHTHARTHSLVRSDERPCRWHKNCVPMSRVRGNSAPFFNLDLLPHTTRSDLQHGIVRCAWLASVSEQNVLENRLFNELTLMKLTILSFFCPHFCSIWCSGPESCETTIPSQTARHTACSCAAVLSSSAAVNSWNKASVGKLQDVWVPEGLRQRHSVTG
jgi:hypothetical protein